ncbi:endonuclease domain-containing protein [Pedobacter sp. KLB.chiD]|uniref:endonuclease domain-containing protein n=1 Tax=Pedobacter sp. KLB.chiD TaxID=3387402 RepID=UPI00399A66E9
MAIHNLKYLKNKRKELRNNLTPAEATMWMYLQNSRLGRKFRRQHSVGNYILDFYCPSEKLAIEVDGSSHDDYSAEMYDKQRTDFLNNKGITVIRFNNLDVFESEELVCGEIKKHFKT